MSDVKYGTPVVPGVGTNFTVTVPPECSGAMDNMHFLIADADGLGPPRAEYFKPGALVELINTGSIERRLTLTNALFTTSVVVLAPGGRETTFIKTVTMPMGGSIICDGVRGGDRTVVDIVVCP